MFSLTTPASMRILKILHYLLQVWVMKGIIGKYRDWEWQR